MSIEQQKLDDLNATLTVTIEKIDFQPEVDKQLQNYKKKASIPGFRPGKVPMSYIKKQYEKPLIFDEVQRLLDTKIKNYITSNSLNIMGNPIPKEEQELDWEGDTLTFEFEMGFAPDFEVAYDKVKTHPLKISVEDAQVTEQIQKMKKSLGETIELDEVTEQSEIGLSLIDASIDIDSLSKQELEKAQLKAFIEVETLPNFKDLLGKKIGAFIEVETDAWFGEDFDYEKYFYVDQPNIPAKGKITIDNISEYELAELNQENLDKAFGKDQVKSEEEAMAKIKENFEKAYQNDEDYAFYHMVLDELLEITDLALPDEFLKKWLLQVENGYSNREDVEKDYDKIRKSFIYQLVENKIAEGEKIQITHEDLMQKAKEQIMDQMIRFGLTDLPEEQLENFAKETIAKEEEGKRIAQELMQEKLTDVFRKKVKNQTKEVSVDEFKEILENHFKKEED